MTYAINLSKLNLPIVMTMYSEELDRKEKKTPEQMLKVEFGTCVEQLNIIVTTPASHYRKVKPHAALLKVYKGSNTLLRGSDNNGQN